MSFLFDPFLPAIRRHVPRLFRAVGAASGLLLASCASYRGKPLVPETVAAALVFLLLLFLYESFHIALAMLASTLLALSAVTVGLWLTGTELNISSMMGVTMIVGIATEVAIFYVSELVALPADRPRGLALIEAGINRMRPIAMTTFAAILALLPLALGIGAGSAMQQPLAIAIVSGLVMQLPAVLIVLPVLLSLRRARSETGSNL